MTFLYILAHFTEACEKTLASGSLVSAVRYRYNLLLELMNGVSRLQLRVTWLLGECDYNLSMVFKLRF